MTSEYREIQRWNIFPIYIHDSNTGMGVQLELWAWVFNAVRVSLQSSNKILDTRDT